MKTETEPIALSFGFSVSSFLLLAAGQTQIAD